MASRRLRRTKSFSSYLAAVNQDIQDLKTTATPATGIASQSITSDAIESALVLDSKSIESRSYIEGISGWKIDGSGVAEFSDVFVRGDINAYSGTIGYWNISSPDVSRRIGTRDLYGTFLESSDLGATDRNKDSGTYVGLYKSLIDVPTPIVSISRKENVATAISAGHRFKLGDLISVDIPSDATLSTGQSAVEVIQIGYNYFRYISYGSDVYEVTGADYAGTATLSNKDVSGLYLQDYGKALFDYGYFSNEGVAYVSAETPNLVYNSSFEFVNVGAENHQSSAASWLDGGETALSIFDFTADNIYKADSVYGGVVSWTSTPLTTYLHAQVNESEFKRLDFYKNNRELYLNFDMFFHQTYSKLEVSAIDTETANRVTVTAPGLVVGAGDLVFLDLYLNDGGIVLGQKIYAVMEVTSPGESFTVISPFSGNPYPAPGTTPDAGYGLVPQAFKFTQAVLDLNDIRISFVTAYDIDGNPVLDSTTSLYDVATDVTRADWDDFRYWSISSSEYTTQLFYDSNSTPYYQIISGMGPEKTTGGFLGGWFSDNKGSMNLKISSSKLESKYRELAPVSHYNTDLEFYISFPQWLWEGTNDTTGSVSVRAVEAYTVSPGEIGYIIDNVSLSPSKKFFYGDFGSDSFYYKITETDQVKTNKVSYEAPRQWLDIDLDYQTAQLKYMDSIELKSSDFLRQLYINPSINTIKSGPTPYGDGPALMGGGADSSSGTLYTGQSSVLNISSGQYKYLTSDGATYRTVEAFSTHETGSSTAVYQIKTVSSTAGTLTPDELSGSEFSMSIDSADKGYIHTYSDYMTLHVGNSLNISARTTPLGLATSSIMELNQNGDMYIASSEQTSVFVMRSDLGSGFVNDILGNNFYLGVTNDAQPKIKAHAIDNNPLTSSYQTVYVSTVDDTLGYVSSSIETKKNIEPLQLAVSSILEAEPVQFNYRVEEDGSPKHAGFIAEQLVDAGLGGYVSFDAEGRPKTVNYEMFVSALQLVARQQAAQIADLTVRVAELEGK